jgi:hypothetical protein
MHSWVGVQILKLSDGVFCEYVLFSHPLVFSVWIPLPPNEVLQLAPSSKMPRGHYSLHFIFFFPVDKVRRRFIVVCAVELCLTIRVQKVYVEHRM